MRNFVRPLAASAITLSILMGGSRSSLAAQQYEEALYDALEWTSVGPLRGGRSTAAAGSDSRPNEYYFGASGGGLWKTTDGGNTWRPVTDGKVHSASVGAVAVCPADPDVVYIGMGETEIRGNIQQGDGVYKSTDGGATWTHMGLEPTQNIAKIRIRPDDCNTAWVAAFGVHSAPNPERGIYKTVDGGQSWKQVLFKSDKAGAIDLALDPHDPDVMYASIWEAWRKSWGMSSGGEDSGIWKSTDGGESWTEITDNLGLKPRTPIGKIGLAVSGANSRRVWALIEHEPGGGVYRSDDGGETWERVNDERKLRQRAFYYSRIYADPQNEDVVYALNTGFYQSTDGGKTFPTSFRVPHGDNHDLWISPSDPERMIESNDGGANVSVNGGKTWTDQEYPTAQFYRVITTAHVPYHICGAQQDNSTACTPSSGWNFLSARGGFGGGGYFYSVGGCESGYIAPNPDPANPDVFYAGCYGGSLSRMDHRTGLTRAINVWPENPMGQSSEDLRERVQWTFPIVFDRRDPGILYTGTQNVWKTLNEGQSWIRMSPDLTRHDPTTIVASGGPITKDQTGVETYATVFAIAPSYHDSNVLWAGSDDGYVHVTRNAQDAEPTWDNVTPPDAPDFIRINTIEASPTTPGKAYVAGVRYLVDNDRHPYVWKTTDYGKSWTKIVRGIPEDDFVRAVREDPTRPGLLYAASEKTVYVSWDDGAHWQPLTMNLPTVQVSDLVVEDHDLVIATHGRAFWLMRNIDLLRQMSDEVAGADAWLFDPKDPTLGFDRAADFFYNLKDDAGKVVFEILDASGNVLGTYQSAEDEEEAAPAAGGNPFSGGSAPKPSRMKGSNHFRWNMHLKGWTDFKGRIFWAAGPTGPTVVPGRYQVRMTVDGKSRTQDFEVKMNPRSAAAGVTVADLRQRFDFALKIRDRVSDANEAVIRIRGIKGQVDDRLGRSDNQELHSLGGVVKDRLGGVESEIYQVKNRSNQDPLNYPIKLNNKIAALLNLVEGSDNRPTDQSYQVFETLSDSLDLELEQMNLVIRQDLARLNGLLRELGLDPIDAEKLITQ